MPRISRPSVFALAGMGVGIVGLLVQFAADPSKFTGANATFGLSFPPGILFILGCAVLVVATSRWWWHPLPAVVIAVWIVGLGALAGKLTPNLVSANLGTVAGTVVMSVGLVAGAACGVWAMVDARRAHAPVAARM